MYSTSSLLAIASEAEKQYLNLQAQHPPGTIHMGRNAAYSQMQQALACATWLETQSVQEMANVGPFMATHIVRGQRVRICRGARVFGTGPKAERGGTLTKRAYVVTVHSSDSGYIDSCSRQPKIVQGKITWAGTGGFWRWTDLNSVETLLAIETEAA